MASRFPKGNFSMSDDFFDVSIREDDFIPMEDQFFSNENDNPNQKATVPSTEEWEFIPTELVPSSRVIFKQNSSSRLATLPSTKKDILSSLKRKRIISLPKLLNHKRPVPSVSFSTYDIVDRGEAPTTAEVELELTQCLLHESVVIDECVVDQEGEMTKPMQYTHPAKRRGSTGDLFLARSDVKWQTALSTLVKSVEDDQEVYGVWLLSEINHWDNESERIVMLLNDSILIAKYNFYTEVLHEVKSIGLSGIYSTTYGPFPKASPFRTRPGIGVRLHWNKDIQLSAIQKWNPWSEKIPYTTFGPHPSTYRTVQCTTESHLNINSFLQKLKECLKRYTIEHDTYVIFDSVDTLTAQSGKLGILQHVHNIGKFGCDTVSQNRL